MFLPEDDEDEEDEETEDVEISSNTLMISITPVLLLVNLFVKFGAPLSFLTTDLYFSFLSRWTAIALGQS